MWVTGQTEGGLWFLLVGGIITVGLGVLYGDLTAIGVGIVCALLGGGILGALNRK